MFVSLRMLTLPDNRVNERDTLIERLRQGAGQLPDVLGNWIAPVYPSATINAGHVIWRMIHASEAAARAATLHPSWEAEIVPAMAGTELTAAGYRLTQKHVRPAGPGVWRALLFSVFPHSDPAKVRELEECTLLLPKYVPEIRNWGLNRTAWSEGRKPIEFVWEQEYDSVDGLTGPYMQTPIHWGIVDAYFDADCPEYIVDPHLIQVVGAIDSPIMEPGHGNDR